MLAQRWEKPSTGQDERRAILRARRLCGESADGMGLQDSDGSSLEVPPHFHDETLIDRQRLKRSNNFIATAWIFGVRPEIIDGIFESAPAALISALSLIEDTPTSRESGFGNVSTGQFEKIALIQMSLMYRWDPTSMERTYVEATPDFCQNLAGMTLHDFHSTMESDSFPLPCSPLQYISYFIDGALCMAEGQMSWTRFVFWI